MKDAARSQIAMKPGTDASHGFRMTTRPPMMMLFSLRPKLYFVPYYKFDISNYTEIPCCYEHLRILKHKHPRKRYSNFESFVLLIGADIKSDSKIV